MHRLEIIKLIPKDLDFRVGVSQVILETLGLFFNVGLDHELLLHKYLFLEGTRIFGFGIGERRTDCSLGTFQIIVAHFQITKLNLESLMFLPKGIKFPM